MDLRHTYYTPRQALYTLLWRTASQFCKERSAVPVLEVLELRFREDQPLPEVTQPESGRAGI